MTTSPQISIGDPAPDMTLPDDHNQPTRLSDLWQRHPIALVFVRHSGCTFCRTQAAELREAYPAIQAAGGEVVLVTMDGPATLPALKAQLELPFPCLSDPGQAGYRAFQCPRGSLWAVAGPPMWGRAIKSLFANGMGWVRGDTMQLPGSFVIDRSGTIRFAHRSQTSADWPPTDELIRSVAASR